MIVKFIGKRGGGSAAATMDYLLGKNRDRAKVTLLSGDPELTQRIADNLNFQNRYTVGVLSFEEKNLEEVQKQEIMQSFEEILLAGLDRDQYDITWIQHTDKERLELNFVIPNVELSTGKRLQPYFDQADRPLVENWKQTINFEYGLTDPHAPDKAQAIKTLNTQHLPQTVKEIKEQIGVAIADQIEKGNIQNRQDVIEVLEQAGFEITRQTDRSISIKNPDGKRNIRLEGVIYEDRQFNQQFAKEHSRAGRNYKRTSQERYDTAFNKLQCLVENKQRTNQETFNRKLTSHQRPTAEYQKSIAFKYSDWGSIGHHTDNVFGADRSKRMVRLSGQSETRRIDRDQFTSRQDPFRKTDFTNSDSQGNRGQKELFDYRQEQQKSRCLYFTNRSSSFENKQIKSIYDHFDDETRNNIEKSHQYAPTHPKEITHEQRIHEHLQYHLERIRNSVKRSDRNQSETERADQNIEYTQSTLARTEQRIEQSKSAISRSQQQVKQQVKKQDRDYGMSI